MRNTKDKKSNKFSLIKRINSANHAWRGVMLVVKTSHNMWGHILISLLAIYLGFILNINKTEWMFLIFVMFLVFITEILNSALEVDIDLTSPTYHPYARDTKDMAAGAVLLAVLLSLTTALFIFAPKIIAML